VRGITVADVADKKGKRNYWTNYFKYRTFKLETGAIERLDNKEVSFRKGGKSTSRLAGNCFRG